jgi:hypothetical protein
MKKKYVSVKNIWIVFTCVTLLNVMIGLANKESLDEFIMSTIYLIWCIIWITFCFSEDK